MTAVRASLAGVKLTPVFLNLPAGNVTKMASNQEPSDVTGLTARMSRGDEAAFHEFYKLYCNRLLRYLFVVAGGQEEIAREALQLSFVRVARHVRRFDSEAAFWNWLAMLARNCVVDEIRKRNRYQGLLSRLFRQRPANADLKSIDADARFAELVQDGLASLPNDERILLERKYFEGEAMRQLADEWQMTEKAMESHLLRVRRKLKNAVLDRLKNETSD
jgi:RNA polymerase sigma factor (sigma-70 family)